MKLTIDDIRTMIFMRAVGHKLRYPDFDSPGFMTWWDCLPELRRWSLKNKTAAQLNMIRRKETRLNRFAAND